MPVVQVLENGQVTLPKQFREVLGLEKGGMVEAELDGERIVITPKRPAKGKDWSQLFAVMDKVHQQNKGVSEEEVIQDVQQAVDEIRAEEYAKQKKS
jgi:AbrB family looped-hinge helix DNA binding protein